MTRGLLTEGGTWTREKEKKGTGLGLGRMLDGVPGERVR